MPNFCNASDASSWLTDWPKAISSSAGQKFEVSYLLLDGCHACAGIRTAILAFDFDSSGRFIKAGLTDVQTGGDSNKAELSDEDTSAKCFLPSYDSAQYHPQREATPLHRASSPRGQIRITHTRRLLFSAACLS